MKRDPYRDQANKSRQEIRAKSDVEETADSKTNEPSRIALHAKKRTEKAAQKKPFPLIRVLLASFVLLPLTVLALSLTIFNDGDGFINATVDRDQPFEFQHNDRANDTEVAGESEETANTAEESIPVSNESVEEEQSDTIEEPKKEVEEEPIEETVEETPTEEIPEEITEETSEDAPQESTKTYTVQTGETLYRIAVNETGSADGVEQIKQLNGLPDNEIYAGQVLKIPTD